MKRIFSIAPLLVLLLAACQTTEAPPTNDPTEEPPSTIPNVEGAWRATDVGYESCGYRLPIEAVGYEDSVWEIDIEQSGSSITGTLEVAYEGTVGENDLDAQIDTEGDITGTMINNAGNEGDVNGEYDSDGPTLFLAYESADVTECADGTFDRGEMQIEMAPLPN